MRLRGLQILVIEDAPDMLDVLTMLLRIEGADVAGAGSGHEALKVFGSRHFDVVVSDLGLPDIAGDILIRTISGPNGWRNSRLSRALGAISRAITEKRSIVLRLLCGN